jgi:hypothetical protein
LRKQYAQAGIYADEEASIRAITDMLLRRLRTGQLSGRARGFRWLKEPKGGADQHSPPIASADGFFAIPPAFWGALSQCSQSARGADWFAGDFEYHFMNEFDDHEGGVIGLEVREDQLPRPFADAGNPKNLSNQSLVADAKVGGRPAARWWPDFAVELALFIHEEGVPPGSGHDGQSEVLDKILGRLSRAGKEEPGRATVQPVINAVLRRIRSAGN